MSNISNSPSMNPGQFFGADGLYGLIVQRNVALHNEAVPVGVDAVKTMLRARGDRSGNVEVLDLACGALPTTISKVMEACDEAEFRYRGIDNNPEQVLLANQTFLFPHNVREVLIEEGNAWDLSDIPDNSQDIIFTGLNLHHGTPDEVYQLAIEVARVLRKDGIFINHDMYRPKSEVYIRRPKANPFDPSDLYLMNPTAKSDNVDLPDFPFKGVDFDPSDPNDWRQVTFLPRFREVLQTRGATSSDIEIACTHVGLRDFCVSTEEMKLVLQRAGFDVEVFDYSDSSEPLKEFYASIVCKKIS